MFSSKTKEKVETSSASTQGGRKVSVITSGTAIEGNFGTEMDVRLEGNIKGEVTINGKIVIGKTGAVDGILKASEAVIHGKVTGNLFVDGLLQLASTAVIEGDIEANQFSVEEGAVYRGKCNIGKSL